jgi:hypothetical protein
MCLLVVVPLDFGRLDIVHPRSWWPRSRIAVSISIAIGARMPISPPRTWSSRRSFPHGKISNVSLLS